MKTLFKVSSLLTILLVGITLLTSISCSEHESTSAKMPLVSINTNGVNIIKDSKIAATMTVKDDATEKYDGAIGINYRGAASYILFPKKSFNLETRDASGNNLKEPFFGMPSDEDWVLQGPYDDKTLIRNIISYDLSNQIGLYAPHSKLVEVEVNNEYLGVYAFTEKIKRDKARVAITQMAATDIDPVGITGGYLLKIDKTSGDNNIDDWGGHAIYTETNSFRSDYDQNGAILNTSPFGAKQSSETYFLYGYPESDMITIEQKNYIKQYVHDFETALTNENFSTSTRAYEDYIDVASFVDYFIMCELSHNADAYRLSTFLSKDRGGKLKMGPLWDMNLCYGSDGNPYRSSSTTWIYQYNTYLPNDLWLVPFWWTKLLQDPKFKGSIKTRWTALRTSILIKNNIYKLIDNNVDILIKTGAKDRNFNRWPIIGVSVPFNGFVGASYEAEIDYMKTWIDQRLTWMDTQISNF